MLAALALLVVAEGPPLFYWGARPAVISVEAPQAAGPEARVREVHAALDKGTLVVRFTFDRAVREATHLADGAPVSGRLRAMLYVDADADRATGYQAGAADPRTGADLRLEIGVLAVGEDKDEKIAANALLTATLTSVGGDGRRHTLWRADDAQEPRAISARGEWLEVRLPAETAVRPQARLILSLADRALDGRLGR